MGCIADSDSESTCTNQSATGPTDPEAIAISPDGNDVYVAAETSEESGDVSEFTRSANGSLTPISDNACIAETGDDVCPVKNAVGFDFPDALAVSPDGDNVYVGSEDDETITTLTRSSTDGSLSQPGGSADCLQDPEEDNNDECPSSVADVPADGLSDVTGVVVSPDGDDVYTSGSPNDDTNGSIAEFSRGAGGALTPIGCVGSPEDGDTCGGGTATGLTGISGLVVSPDGDNMYTASEEQGGPISEFSRGAGVCSNSWPLLTTASRNKTSSTASPVAPRPASESETAMSSRSARTEPTYTPRPPSPPASRTASARTWRSSRATRPREER